MHNVKRATRIFGNAPAIKQDILSNAEADVFRIPEVIAQFGVGGEPVFGEYATPKGGPLFVDMVNPGLAGNCCRPDDPL